MILPGYVGRHQIYIVYIRILSNSSSQKPFNALTFTINLYITLLPTFIRWKMMYVIKGERLKTDL